MSRPLVLLDPHPRRRAMIFSAAQEARLSAMAEVVAWEGEGAMPDALVEGALPHAVVILGQTALDADRLARAPRLRAVINVEGNFRPDVDYEACRRQGVEVLSVAPIFAVPVAEMTLGFVLDLARGIRGGDRAMREGTEAYGRAGNSGARLVSRSLVGLVGFGNLGRALRRLLAGFGCPILVHDPWLPDAAIREEGCEPAALDDLLARADVVVLLAGATAENAGFIDRAALARIRDDASVVLASRAAIVDFPALCAEAASGRLRVATDVFPVEPVPPGDPVRRNPMLLSAHRAGGVPDAFHDLGERVLDDLDLVLRGLPPVRLQRAQAQTAGRMRSPAGRTYGAAEVGTLASR